MRSLPILCLGMIVLLLRAPSTVGANSVSAQATPAAGGEAFSGLVDIGGGREIWLECLGSGSPTVILESGYGNNAEVWDAVGLPPDSEEMAVLPGVAAFTRVCAYDRPGTMLDADHRSRSDPVAMPRTVADAVADLHALLQGAGVPGPYVMAGHSLGGVIGRLYAASYPDEVAGLVLVDSGHEEQNVRFEAALGAEHWATLSRLQEQAAAGAEGDAETEQMDLDASFAQLREAAAARPLPALPLVVLTHSVPVSDELPADLKSQLPPDFPWGELERVWQELQADLAQLTPGSRQVFGRESGHYIQFQQPELVIEAIREVVEAVRDPASWDASGATPGA